MKKKDYFLLSLAVCFLPASAIVLGAAPKAIAQITPDTTLPVNAIITSDGKTFTIEGGTSSGSNLFLSFKQFSVPINTEAFFNNSLAIQNIFSRVTGGSISKIDGLIRANGTANLFLLNPNGIIFGPNASLNVGGSFIATTATQINFADSNFFSAKCCPTQPLLTISVPIGLGFGSNPGTIVNQSQVTTLSPMGVPIPTGLQVLPGQTLALVGGEIRLDGGHLTTSGGRIELGSVASQSQVSLNPTNPGYTLGYEGVENFEDVQLSNLAEVNASGLGGGEIQVQGRNIILTGGSKITSNTLGSIPGRNITINASDSVQVLGTTTVPGRFEPSQAAFGIFVPLRSSIDASTFGEGNAGTITINTRQLILQDGARINTSAITAPGTTTVGAVAGKGGDVIVNASDFVDVNGVVEVMGSGRNPIDLPGLERFFVELNGVSSIATVSIGSGDAGDITINTGRLFVRNGGIITANPFLGGQGGNLTVNAADSVEVKGISSSGIVNSSIVTTALGVGNAGDITINAGELRILDGATVNTLTANTGKGGNLTVNARNSVEVRSTSVQNFSSLRADALASGTAGNLRIDTRHLIISDGAQVRVSGSGTGRAGNLQVNASNLRLNNSILTAATASGEGGNINLQVQDILRMRDNSLISAEAGGIGNGGNIGINTKFLVAVPQENSDIIANAFQGRGGNINITAQGIFGLEFRERLTPLSDITASSEFGVEGVVEINAPDIDLNRGLVELPSEPGVPEPLQGCQTRGGQATSSFVNIGRGGLLPSPTEPLSSSDIWEDVQLPAQWAENSNATDTRDRIVEAQGWFVNEQGEVVLSAQVSPQTNVGCWLTQSADGKNSESTNGSGTTQP